MAFRPLFSFFAAYMSGRVSRVSLDTFSPKIYLLILLKEGHTFASMSNFRIWNHIQTMSVSLLFSFFPITDLVYNVYNYCWKSKMFISCRSERVNHSSGYLFYRAVFNRLSKVISEIDNYFGFGFTAV